MNRLFILICATILTMSTPSLAADKDTETLKEIATFAESVCKSESAAGNKTQLQFRAELGAQASILIKKLTDIGVDGSIIYSSDEYMGLNQEDLYKNKKDAMECKLKLIEIIKDKIIKRENTTYILNNENFIEHIRREDTEAIKVYIGKNFRLSLDDARNYFKNSYSEKTFEILFENLAISIDTCPTDYENLGFYKNKIAENGIKKLCSKDSIIINLKNNADAVKLQMGAQKKPAISDDVKACISRYNEKTFDYYIGLLDKKTRADMMFQKLDVTEDEMAIIRSIRYTIAMRNQNTTLRSLVEQSINNTCTEKYKAQQIPVESSFSGELSHRYEWFLQVIDLLSK